MAETTRPRFNGTWQILFQGIQQFGLPAALLVLVLWWLAIYVAQPLIDAHTQFLQEHIAVTQSQLDLMRQLDSRVSTLQQGCKQAQEDHRAIMEITRRQTEVLSAIQRCIEDMSRERLGAAVEPLPNAGG